MITNVTKIDYEVYHKPRWNANIATRDWRKEKTFDTLTDAIKYSKHIESVGHVKIIERITLENDLSGMIGID